MRIKILVIDDEESYCEILRYNLEKDGYEVDTAPSAEEALTYDLPTYQLMIVDIMMENISGFDFAKRVRNNPATENIPIIFCSALGGEDDTVMGLNIGADDYITKPFLPGEVLARVRAVLRRTHQSPHPADAAMASGGGGFTSNSQQHSASTQSHYGAQTQGDGQHSAGFEPDVVFKGLRVNRNERSVYIDGEEQPLTPKEYELLLFFLLNRERIHSREEIMRNVWDTVVSNRAIDTNITRLRQKIGAYGDHIVTKQGFGYGFHAEI